VASARIHPVIRWAFCLFVASLPFELPERQVIPFEIPTITGALFLATTLLQPRVCFGRVPAAVVAFLGTLYVYAVSAAWNGWINGTEVWDLLLLMVQGMLIFWTASNLLREDELARTILWSLVLACGVRAALPLLGIGRTAYVVWTGGERITAFGQNANASAVILAAGLLTLIGLGQTDPRGGLRPRVLMWPLGALLGIAIIDTGSRGGLLALGIGLVALVMSAAGSAWATVRRAAAVALAIGFLVVASYRSELMRNRFEDTAQTGTMAGRELLFPALWDMTLEKPWLGWGPINNQYEVGLRIGERVRPKRDAHNLGLELLTASGVLGTIPFLIGLWLCARAAWQARRGPHGTLPLALLVALLASNMSGNRIGAKLFWLVLAYPVAAVAATRARAEPRPSIRVSRLVQGER